MERTQVYLGSQERELLDHAALRTGASRSELIRRAIRAQYGTVNFETRRATLRATAGGWQDWPVSGEEYVEGIRGDLNERLRRLGWP
ncbi:ribbon-helix-helix domain-containing protein [soil metagenome]